MCDLWTSNTNEQFIRNVNKVWELFLGNKLM